MPNVRLKNQSVPLSAVHKRKWPDKKSNLVLHLLGKIVENTARAALAQKELLTLSDAAVVLSTSDTTLRSPVPGLGELRARFRMLAAIHHPDSGHGSHERMSQLNSAMDILGRGS